MRKVVKVVIGSNYGDEGKGLMTDFFCRQFPDSQEVLNVRYNGGAQAGHTVLAKDKRRHVFSHFGSGSFHNDVTTCLGPQFILNPILFKNEWDRLEAVGVTPKPPLIFNMGLITFPMDMMINQFIENARGRDRHGSCGVGINETVERFAEKSCAFTPENFLRRSKEEIFQFIKDQEPLWAYYKNRLNTLGLTLSEEQAGWFFNEYILQEYAADLLFMLEHTTTYENVADLTYIYDNFVFEGAQGLLLDMDNGVYTTTSHPGLEYILPWFRYSRPCNVEICYVTRTYFTRHGAGPFPTECKLEDINKELVDNTNLPNDFQGAIRYGYFDLNAFKGAIHKQRLLYKDIVKHGHSIKDGVAITHFNITKGFIKPNKYTIFNMDYFLHKLAISPRYLSVGENMVIPTAYNT